MIQAGTLRSVEADRWDGVKSVRETGRYIERQKGLCEQTETRNVYWLMPTQLITFSFENIVTRMLQYLVASFTTYTTKIVIRNTSRDAPHVRCVANLIYTELFDNFNTENFPRLLVSGL